MPNGTTPESSTRRFTPGHIYEIREDDGALAWGLAIERGDDDFFVDIPGIVHRNVVPHGPGSSFAATEPGRRCVYARRLLQTPDGRRWELLVPPAGVPDLDHIPYWSSPSDVGADLGAAEDVSDMLH